MSKYQVTQENNEWIVSTRKTGLVIGYFDHQDQAEEYRAAQDRGDERHAVLSAYNGEQELRALRFEFQSEFTA